MMLRNVNRSFTQHRLQTLCLNSRIVGSSTTFYRSESSASSSGQPAEYESKLVETLKVAGDNANAAKDSKFKTLKATQNYSTLVKEAVDSGIEQNESAEVWTKVTKAKEEMEKIARQDSGDEAKARAAIEALKQVITEGRKRKLETPTIQNAIATVKKLSGRLDELNLMIQKERTQTRVFSQYKELMEAGRQQWADELSAAFPDINLRAKEGSLTKEELNAFIVHASTRINQLKEQLAEHQKVEALTNEENVNLIAQLQQQKQDFEGRIAQLQQEKTEILKILGKKLAEEEDEQIMQPMHEMKVQLPLENWFDMLAFVPRRQLGMLAYQIGDFQFACILQSFLHDERRIITLGRMEIILPRYHVPSDRSIVRGSQDEYVDLPDSPMPENVKNFEEISLKFNYADLPEPFVDFLRKFQENSLLTNVKLDFGYYEEIYWEDILPTLTKIIPLISSIDSINFCALNVFDWFYEGDEESKLLLMTMVAQAKFLSIDWDYEQYGSNCTWKDTIDWCLSWLYSPRDDGMPRTLIAEDNLETTHYSSLIDRIKKDFLEANQAVSFFIRLHQPYPRVFQRALSLNNDKTNEKLVVKEEVSKRSLLISRRSSKAAKRKIEEDEKEILDWVQNRGPKHICLTMDE